MQDSNKQDQEETFELEIIKEYIIDQKTLIERREMIESLLMYISCQVASASLAIILFQYAVQISFISWLCFVISWIPSMMEVGGFRFKKDSSGVEIEFVRNPIRLLFKFVSGTFIVWITMNEINQQLQQTYDGLSYVQEQIKNYETPKVDHFYPGLNTQTILIAAAITGVVFLVSALKKRNPFD